MAEVKISKTLQYDPKDLESSTYNYSRLTNLSGNNSGYTMTEQPELTWEIPVKCFNMARSKLAFEVAFAAGDASGVTIVHNLPPIEAMTIMTRTGKYLLNIPSRFMEYCDMVCVHDATPEDLHHGDRESTLYSNNGDANEVRHPVTNAVDAQGPNARSYVRIVATVAQEASTFKYMIPFSYFKKSFLSLDRTFLAREILVVKVKFASPVDFAYEGVYDNLPSLVGTAAAPAATLNKAYLYLAQERNSGVVASLSQVTDTDQGMTLLCDYPTIVANPRTTDQPTVHLRINKSHGSSLKSIKHAVYLSAGTRSTRFDRNNVNTVAGKILNYRTEINGNPLADFQLVAADNTDLLQMKHKLEESWISHSETWRTNYFIEDEFQDYADKDDSGRRDGQIYSGIDLNRELEWSYSATGSATAARHISVIHAVKFLNVNNLGIILK